MCFELCLFEMRDKIARLMLDNKGPMFGNQIYVEMAALPEYADALLPATLLRRATHPPPNGRKRTDIATATCRSS